MGLSPKQHKIFEKANMILEEKEYEERCVRARICPECGERLNISSDNVMKDLVCTNNSCGYRTTELW